MCFSYARRGEMSRGRHLFRLVGSALIMSYSLLKYRYVIMVMLFRTRERVNNLFVRRSTVGQRDWPLGREHSGITTSQAIIAAHGVSTSS